MLGNGYYLLRKEMRKEEYIWGKDCMSFRYVFEVFIDYMSGDV